MNKPDLTLVKEIKELDNVEEANKYIEGLRGSKWVLLDLFLGKQLCFQKVTVGENNFEKLQPFDKIVRLYVIGRIK